MQAMILTAYKNLEEVARRIRLYSEQFEVYVHIDKKCKEDGDKAFANMPKNVHIYSLYKINWGGANHLKCILYLMNEALQNKQITYLHLITGEDFPIKPLDDIYDFFEGREEVFFHCTALDKMDKKRRCRVSSYQKYYQMLNVFDYKKIPQKIFVKGMVFLQALFGVNRLDGAGMCLFQGLVWGDYPRKAVEYCFSYAKQNPGFLAWLEYGLASEEFFFHPVLGNSEEWSGKINQNNFRYMLWERKNGSYPAILDSEDWERIRESDCMFARKLDPVISKELIQIIEERIL